MGSFWYLRRIKLASLFYLESYNYSAIKDEKIKRGVKQAQNLIKQIKKSKKITPDLIDNLTDANFKLIEFLVEEELNKKNIPKGHAKTIESKSLGGKMTIISDKDEDYFKRSDKKHELLSNKEKKIFGFAEFNGTNYHAYFDICQCLKYLFERRYPLFSKEYFYPDFPFGEKIKIQRFDYEIVRAMTPEELNPISYNEWKNMQEREGRGNDLGYYLKLKGESTCLITRNSIFSPKNNLFDYFSASEIRKISLGKHIRQMLPEMEKLLKEWNSITLKKIEGIIKSNKGFKNKWAELTFSAEDAYEILKDPQGYEFTKEVRGHEFTKKVYDYLKNISDDELIIWDHHY